MIPAKLFIKSFCLMKYLHTKFDMLFFTDHTLGSPVTLPLYCVKHGSHSHKIKTVRQSPNTPSLESLHFQRGAHQQICCTVTHPGIKTFFHIIYSMYYDHKFFLGKPDPPQT